VDSEMYVRLALRTMADQEPIKARQMCLPKWMTQAQMALNGLVDEVGEIAAIIKKHVEYGKPFDKDNMKEEVGDALWRLAQLCDACGFSMGDAMASNVFKLRQRYPERYSDELAAEENRNRAAEADAMRQSAPESSGWAASAPLTQDPDLQVN
jgi:NTP pyrophosphatase (non-canonical NTP hydrolase)